MPMEICCTFTKEKQLQVYKGKDMRTDVDGESRRKEKREESYSVQGVGVRSTETIISINGHGQRSQDTLKFHYIDTWGTDWGQL